MGCARGSGQVVGGGCQGYAGPDTWQVHQTRHSGEESGSIWYIPFLVLSRFDEMTCNLQRDGLRRLSVYEGNDEGLRGDSRWRGRRGCTGILNEYRLPTCLIIPFPLTRQNSSIHNSHHSRLQSQYQCSPQTIHSTCAIHSLLSADSTLLIVSSTFGPTIKSKH